MDWVHQHRSDLAAILAEKLQSGVIDRRGFLQGLAALGLVAAVRPSPAGAASGELVVVNWGGLAATAFEKAWAKPCQEKLGLKMVVDGSTLSGDDIQDVRKRIESGQLGSGSGSYSQQDIAHAYIDQLNKAMIGAFQDYLLSALPR